MAWQVVFRCFVKSYETFYSNHIVAENPVCQNKAETADQLLLSRERTLQSFN